MKKEVIKVAHFFWGSNKKMPYFNFLSIETFKKFHKDWKIILHTSIGGDLDRPSWRTWEQQHYYDGKDYFKEAKKICDEFVVFDYEKIGFSNNIHPVHKADILRQFLMYEVGGLWSDMDVLWLNNFEKIGLDDVDITVVVHQWHSSGIMYSCGAKNKFYENIFNTLKEKFNTSEYQSAGPSLLDKLYPSFDIICLSYPEIVFKNIDYNIFYPYYPNEIPNFYSKNGKNLRNHQTLCIHWFGGHPASGEFVKTFTEENLNLFSGSPVYETILNLKEK